MTTQLPYNPLDKWNLAQSVADALAGRDVSALPPAEWFEGAGIYAIYYVGVFAAYAPYAAANANGRFRSPIYVGKAVPAGARRGGIQLEGSAGPVLFNRLREHARSIEESENLDLSDFWCRYLVVDDIWIPLGEALLIQNLSPLWNLRVDGFGNHDPGSGRYRQQRSSWDTLHPGRSWAAKCQPGQRSAGAVASEAERFLSILDL
jgi:hypothetical protein